MSNLPVVCAHCGVQVAPAELMPHLRSHLRDMLTAKEAAAAAQPQPWRPIPLKRFTYAMHESLYGRHSNPRKCGTYAMKPCAAHGHPHPCPN